MAVYGYRKEPWGIRGCISKNGIDWSLNDEFIIRKGGQANTNINEYWHTGYPTVTKCDDGTVITAYHQYSKEKKPIQEMWITKFIL